MRMQGRIKRTVIRFRKYLGRGKSIGQRIRQQIFTLDGGFCVWCGSLCTPESATLDHLTNLSDCVVAGLSAREANAPDNLVTACWICNNKRGVLIIKIRDEHGLTLDTVKRLPHWKDNWYLLTPAHGRFKSGRSS